MAYDDHPSPYEVHTALREDINEGWVWVKDKRKNEFEGHRRIVRIRYLESKVHCEALYADDLYLDRFDKVLAEHSKSGTAPHIDRTKDCVFISAWYRRLLGIEHTGHTNLTIAIAESLWQQLLWQLLACLQHPQVVVLLATALGIVGVGLGIIGVGLGFISIKEVSPLGTYIGMGLMAVGIIAIALGIVPLFKRARKSKM